MKYKLGVCSLFRDSMMWNGSSINQIERYFNQMYGQTDIDMKDVGFFLLEGDSGDNTREVLEHYARENSNIHIFNQQATFQAVASTDDPARIASLSRLGTRVINESKDLCENVMFVESDLIMPNHMVANLLEGLQTQENAGIVAPIAMLDNQNVFYDTWAFRNLDGERWTNDPPFSQVITKYDRYIPMQSVGSCAIINGNALRGGANFYEGAFVELCRQVKLLGYNVYADKGLVIRHPASHLLWGRWV